MPKNISYKYKKKIKLRPEEFGGLLFDPKHWRIYQVNKISYQVLNFCKIARTFKEILEFISKQQQSEFSPEEVSNFLDRLIYIEVLEKNDL